MNRVIASFLDLIGLKDNYKVNNKGFLIQLLWWQPRLSDIRIEGLGRNQTTKLHTAIPYRVEQEQPEQEACRAGKSLI